MQNFPKKSALGLLTIVMVAGLGYLVLMPLTATAARPAADEIASHSAGCPVCRLPLYGRAGVASKLGHDPRASADAAEATHEGTILR
jgi:hypothetical protein